MSRDRAASRASLVAALTASTGTGLLLFAAPFEARQPLLRLPGQSFSTVEIVIIVVFAAWLAACVVARRPPQWRTPLTVPWTAFVAAAFIAALASADRTNALHMTGRFGLAFGVFLVAVNGVSTFPRLNSLVATSTVAGVVVSSLVLMEYANVPRVVEWLRLFRENVAHVGAQIRAGGPFPYPTIASMYLELVFALTLGLFLVAVDGRRHVLATAVGLLLVALAEAITVTFTRTGLITITTSLVLVGVLRFRERGLDRGVTSVAVLSLVVALQILTVRSIEFIQLRMTTEGQNAWYQAAIDAPDRLTFPAGGAATVTVTLTNTGYSSWDPASANPFRFSYHWLLADADRVVNWEGVRTEFPRVVRAGESVTLQARVVAPREPGEYRLMWDVEQQDRLWFSTEPDASPSFSRATVAGAATGTIDRDELPTMPARAVRPGRLVLWSAAARMFADHPLLGVGPDNFRLSYGRYAALPAADPRVHSNNMYLEILAGGGVVMAAAFFWLAWTVASIALALVRPVTGRGLAPLVPGIVAATAAVGIHGLSDSFLSFTGTYIAIAVTLGLLVGADRLTRGGAAAGDGATGARV